MLYDCIIIGGGPAGLTAGIYARRANKQVLIIERFAPGGQLNLIGKIENYTGFESVDGVTLSEKFYAHAQAAGISFQFTLVTGYQLEGPIKKVICQKQEYQCKTVILAMGSHTMELNLPGEKDFVGRGVSYCAVCDGNFFKDKTVAVIGSSVAAATDVNYLAGTCRKVYLLTKGSGVALPDVLVAAATVANVELIPDMQIEKIIGSDHVEALSGQLHGNAFELAVDGVFVAIGRAPDTKALQGVITLDEKGFIITDAHMQTSIAGVFACGDIRAGSLRQIATAVGDGAIAGTEAVKQASIWDARQKQKK